MSQTALLDARVRLAPERPADAARVDRLIAAAFGPGRFAKTAERLREGNRLLADLSVCGWSGGELVGAVRLWPTAIGQTRAVFLGPIAVEPIHRRNGLGAALVEAACEAARGAGESLVLLVGDPPFFGPLGFEHAPTEVRLPGPVDPARVLWRGLQAGALEGVAGPVRPLPSSHASA